MFLTPVNEQVASSIWLYYDHLTSLLQEDFLNVADSSLKSLKVHSETQQASLAGS